MPPMGHRWRHHSRRSKKYEHTIAPAWKSYMPLSQHHRKHAMPRCLFTITASPYAREGASHQLQGCSVAPAWPSPMPKLHESCLHHDLGCKIKEDPMETLTYCDDDEQPCREVCCVGQVPNLLPHQDGCKQAPQKPRPPASHCIQTQVSRLWRRHLLTEVTGSPHHTYVC